MSNNYGNSFLNNMLINFLNKQIKKSKEDDHKKNRNFYIKLKLYLNIYFKKLCFNKKLKIKSIKWIKIFIKIYEENKENIQKFQNKTIISAIMFLILKEIFDVKFGFIFELNIDLDLDDLNECLNILFF